MEEEEEESSEEPAKYLAKNQNLRSVWNRAVRSGKTAVIAGAAIASAPVVIPAVVVGFAFSVPFGIYFAGLAYTDNVMRALFLSNCQYEIVEDQDVQIVVQDKDTSSTSPNYLNANLEEVEIKHTSQDDTNEKYYDSGTYANTNIVLHNVQENKNSLTPGSDESNGDDICIFMQSSRDAKCDSELLLSSNDAECGDMIFPVHLEEEALNEAGCRDIEIQHASENVNDQNSNAEIYYEEQEKLSELQQHGCGSGIEALGLNEGLHKLQERSIGEECDIKEDGFRSFNVVEPTAEKKETVTRKDDESMNVGMDFSKRNYNAEAYNDEKKNLSDLQQHGCGLGIEALGLNEALHKLEEGSISNEDDIREDVGHSFNVIAPAAEMMDTAAIKGNESTYEDDSDERDSNAETYNEENNNFSTSQHGCGSRIEELGLRKALREMEVRVIVEEDRTNECDNSPFIIQEPLVENEERDISNADESMNEDIKFDGQDLDSMVLTDEPGKEECALEVKALHKMEDRVIAETDGTMERNNPPSIVFESPVEKEEKYISDKDESMNNYTKLDDQELDSMDLKDGHEKEEYALGNDGKIKDEVDQELDSMDLKDDPEEEEYAFGNDGKIKDEVDSEAVTTAVSENVSTGEAESKHGSVHVFSGDNSHSETNQSIVNELNKFGTEAPMLGNETHENEENVIEEIDKRIECCAFPDQPLDDNAWITTLYKPNDQIGDEQLYNPVHYDKKGTGEVEHERDDSSAKMDMDHHTMLQPNPNDEEIDLEKDEIGEGCHMELKYDNEGPTDYIELKDDTIMETGKEEENDIRASTEMSCEHPREAETVYIELKDDINWDTSKEEEETPLLASIKTEDEMEGNMEDNEETNANIVPDIENSASTFDRSNAMDDNLILEDMDNKVKVQEETSEDQPKTSYLYAAVMPKEAESEIFDHNNEKGTVDVKQQEMAGDGSFMAKDDKPLEELPTVPEEREISFEFPGLSSEKTMENQPKTDLLAELNIDGSYMVKDDKSIGNLPTVPEEQTINFEAPGMSSNLETNLNRTDEKVEDSSEGELYVLGDETKDEANVETKEILASMEYGNENVESSISIEYAYDAENHSSDITSAKSRTEVTIVEGSEVVHFHDEMIYSEDAIWEQIQALRTIIGCKAEMQSSLTDELKALYLLIGVEKPAFLEETSDLIEVTEKLVFLKSVIGVK